MTVKEARVAAVNRTKQAPALPDGTPPFPDGITHEFVLVDPDYARLLLDSMHANRTKSRLNKGLMAALLQEGNFFPGISPVYLDADGLPYDGQHRLEAITETGIPAWLLFIGGITDEMAEYIDTGRSRTRADHYKIKGIPDYKKKSVISRILAIHAKYGQEGVRNPSGLVITPQEQDAWVAAPGMEEALRASDTLYRTLGASPTLLAYALMRTMRLEDGEPDIDPTGFWGKLKSGAGMEEGDPALTARNFLMKDSKAGRIPADPRLMTLYLLATAWNYSVLGRSWEKVSPRYERTGAGRKYFPAGNVPDFLPWNAREMLPAQLRAAYAAVKR